MKLRGEAIHHACKMSKGNMYMVNCNASSKLGLAIKLAQQHSRNNSPTIDDTDNFIESDCKVASYLYPSCKIISGDSTVSVFLVS